MIYQLIYSSEAAPQLDDDGIQDILEGSRIDNEDRGVTGALIFVDRVFVQILEGEKEAVEALMDKIERDPRHHDVTVIHEGETEARLFESWRMAFLNPDPAQMSRWANLPGAGSIEDIVATLDRNPDHVPEVLERIVRTLGSA